MDKSLKKFSAVVEKIYDAATDTDQWQLALEHIRAYIGATSIRFHIGRLDTMGVLSTSGLWHYGFSDTFLNMMPEYAHMWALQANMAAWQVGDVQHLPDILPREEFVSGRFYRECLKPNRQNDYLGMIALKDTSNFVPFSATTEFEHGLFAPESVRRMRLLAPHICRSTKIGIALELKTIHASLLEATLNSLSAGIYLTGRDGRIIFMNNAAESQVKRGMAVTVSNNRLTPRDVHAAAALHNSLAEDDFGAGPISIALPAPDGGMVATVLPLEGGKREYLMLGVKHAAFAVFVQDPAIMPPIPGEGFAQLHDLTPAEFRILSAVVRGHAPQDIADILGIALATVKTHLNRIFHKTGTTRQIDLVQMVQRATPPLAG